MGAFARERTPPAQPPTYTSSFNIFFFSYIILLPTWSFVQPVLHQVPHMGHLTTLTLFCSVLCFTPLQSTVFFLSMAWSNLLGVSSANRWPRQNPRSSNLLHKERNSSIFCDLAQLVHVSLSAVNALYVGVKVVHKAFNFDYHFMKTFWTYLPFL